MKLLTLTLISGALLALSLPPYDLELLGWFALMPLLIAACGQRPLVAIGMGVLTGVICGAIHVGWYPDLSAMQFAYVPFVWLALLLGPVAAIAAVARRRLTGLPWALFVTCAAVSVEWLTTFSPLPLNLALCQYRATAIIQIAALTGIWGVSFLLWFVNAALADAVLSSDGARFHKGSGSSMRNPGNQEGNKRSTVFPSWFPGFLIDSSRFRVFARRVPARGTFRDLKQSVLPSALVAAVAALAIALGYSLLAQARSTGPTMRVAAIQDFREGETAGFLPAGALASHEADQDELTRQAATRGARLIVWSEKCLGETFAPDASVNPTADLARELGAHLVVGYEQPAQPKPFNCAAIVAPDGRVKGVHRKLHPFLGERQGMQCGSKATAFRTDLGKIGMEICFDSCYPEVTRRITRAGARLIAMPNWDPPMPRGILHRLHSAMQPFRAVENHVPFIRADANGLSQIIDARGRLVVNQAPLFRAAALVGDVPLGDGTGTLFTRWGDWFAYVCLLMTASLSLAGRRSHVAVKTTSPTAGASE